MINITIRLDTDLNDKLDTFCLKAGTAKSSLIQIALYDTLTTDVELFPFPVVTDTAIRRTLNITDTIAKLLNEKSKQYGISKNRIINYIVNDYITKKSIWFS
jgi:hypothetical protein